MTYSMSTYLCTYIATTPGVLTTTRFCVKWSMTGAGNGSGLGGKISKERKSPIRMSLPSHSSLKKRKREREYNM